MSTMKTWLRLGAAAAALVAGGFVGTHAATGGGTQPIIQYPTNASGQTYGLLRGAAPGDTPPTDLADMPDLIAVVGENNVKGYAYKNDLMGDDLQPSSPAEAVKLQAARTRHYINVYASDGKAIVGRMKVG